MLIVAILEIYCRLVAKYVAIATFLAISSNLSGRAELFLLRGKMSQDCPLPEMLLLLYCQRFGKGNLPETVSFSFAPPFNDN